MASPKAYVLIKPPATVVSSHLVGKTVFAELKIIAEQQGLCIYEGTTVQCGDRYEVQSPLTLLVESQLAAQPQTASADAIRQNACPYCNKQVKSRFGLTNHVRQAHPSQLEEYRQCQIKIGT